MESKFDNLWESKFDNLWESSVSHKNSRKSVSSDVITAAAVTHNNVK